jgi:hypothetical protein
MKVEKSSKWKKSPNYIMTHRAAVGIVCLCLKCGEPVCIVLNPVTPTAVHGFSHYSRIDVVTSNYSNLFVT